MNVPKISVIVPCYNVEQYLDRCLESLIKQTFEDIEIILVDDKSPDNTPRLCDNWSKRDSRIKVIHKEENQGLGLARNTGIAAATGEFIMFLDSDDIYELDACARMYNTAIQYNADVVTGDFIVESQPGVWHQTQDYEYDTILEGDEIKNYILDLIASKPGIVQDRLHPVSVCLLCIRRTIISKNNLQFLSEREIASEDTLFKISLLNHCSKMVCLRYPFYHYFLNGASLTHTYRPQSFDNLKRLRDKLLEVAGNTPKYVQRIDRFIISDIRANISRLIVSNEPHKLAIIKRIIRDDIWNSLRSFSPEDYKGLYARLFHRFCIWKKPFLVLTLVNTASLARRIKRN